MKMERLILHLLTKPPTSSSTSLFEGGLYSTFEELVVHLGGDVGKVSRGYAIDHPSQRASFENYRLMITEKHADSEKLFKKDGWRQASDAAVRKRYLLHLAEKITKFRHDFNDGDKAFVVPVVLRMPPFGSSRTDLGLWRPLVMDSMDRESTSPPGCNMQPVMPRSLLMEKCS